MLKDIAVLLPALNEDREIEKVIREVPKTFFFNGDIFDTKIYVADSESTDNTVEVALRNNCEVIMCNRGKGKTVKKAIGKILKAKNFKYLVMLDSDGTYPPYYLIPMIVYLEQHPEPIKAIVGVRETFSSKKCMTFTNFIGNTLLTYLSRLLYPITTPDLCSGFWCLSRPLVEGLDLKAEGFDLEANLLTEINRLKASLYYLPIHYRERQESETKLKVRHGFDIARFLIEEKLIQRYFGV